MPKLQKQCSPKREKTCRVCKENFMPKSGRQVYCSIGCAQKDFVRNRKKYQKKQPIEPRNCIICGSKFQPKTRNRKTCSKQCQRKMIRIKYLVKAEERMRQMFSKGEVWILDETTWEWKKKEIRGD